ncbi:MAG: glycogen synthase [Acidimicrobiales bacterium]
MSSRVGHPPPRTGTRVLFATAEYAPIVKVGGLSEASSGLVGCLRSLGTEVEVIMPDYGLVELTDVTELPLDGLPSWMPATVVRRGWSASAGPITLIHFAGSERENPYVDPATGEGWPDNADRFLSFSTAVASYAEIRRPDVVHCNDWHAASTIALLPSDIGSVLTVHNLAHQGWAGAAWASRFGTHGRAFLEAGAFNALAGGISLADRVVLVSESYAAEALLPETGCGLHHRLAARGAAVSGIRNGIDPGLWDPGEDPLLPVTFDHRDLTGKEICRKELLKLAGLESERGPVIGIVARFVHQKGIDLALELAPFLRTIPARLVMIGMGSPDITRLAQDTVGQHPDVVALLGGYDEERAHLVVAGSDLLLVPSRFEPCGLTQMQAMTCGTLPVVTPVGGLRDTVIDTDACPRSGTGFVAGEATPLGLLDAIHRASRGWSNPRRRGAVQQRGMTADWSWATPAREYANLYQHVR